MYIYRIYFRLVNVVLHTLSIVFQLSTSTTNTTSTALTGEELVKEMYVTSNFNATRHIYPEPKQVYIYINMMKLRHI